MLLLNLKFFCFFFFTWAKTDDIQVFPEVTNIHISATEASSTPSTLCVLRDRVLGSM